MIALVLGGGGGRREEKGRNDKGKKRLSPSSRKISFPLTPKDGLILKVGQAMSSQYDWRLK